MRQQAGERLFPRIRKNYLFTICWESLKGSEISPVSSVAIPLTTTNYTKMTNAKHSRLRAATILLVVSMFWSSGCSPKPEALIPKIQLESQAFVNALNTGNADQASKMLYDKLVKLIPMPLEEWLQMRLKGYNSNGYRFESAQVGVPQLPQESGGCLVSFVPVQTRMVPDESLHPSQMRLFGPRSINLATYVVAVSENKGKTWTFFEAGENRQLADALLADISKNLVFPGRMAEVDTN